MKNFLEKIFKALEVHRFAIIVGIVLVRYNSYFSAITEESENYFYPPHNSWSSYDTAQPGTVLYLAQARRSDALFPTVT